jgi:hypothetical protein
MNIMAGRSNQDSDALASEIRVIRPVLPPKGDNMNEKIYEYLKVHALGRESAIKFDVIAQEFGISWREVASAVEDLRLEGKIISCSRRPPYGAYIPSTAQEAKDSLLASYAALWAQKKALDTLSEAIEKEFGEGIVAEVQKEFSFEVAK